MSTKRIKRPQKAGSRKKIILGIFAFLIVIVVFALAGRLLPSKTFVTKSILINAPASYVFDEMEDLEKWPEWSYWHDSDPEKEITFGKVRKGIRASYNWKGKYGSGKLALYGHQRDSLLMIELEFADASKADWKATFDPDGNFTRLTLTFEYDNGNGILDRWSGYLFTKSRVESAFQHDLKNLKEIAEAKPVFSFEITEESLAPTYYASLNYSLTPGDISTQMVKPLNELMAALKRANVTSQENPFWIHTSGDGTSLQRVCGLTIPPDAKLPAQYPILQQYSGAAVRGVHKGGYSTLANTHQELKKYLVFKQLTQNGNPWEVFVVSPLTESDSSKWITEVFYPVEF